MAVEYPKILCHNIVADNSSLVATPDTASGYDVANVHDWRTYTQWKGDSDGDVYYLTCRTRNDCLNGDFETWSAGASSDPDNWTKAGGGAIARESSTVKMGTYSAELTSDGDGNRLAQSIDIVTYRGKEITLSGWVYFSGGSNEARLVINDDVDGLRSVFHTGSVGWEYLTITETINASATTAEIRCQLAGDTLVAYFDEVDFAETKYKTADSYSVFSHNLHTSDAIIRVQYSSDNFDTSTMSTPSVPALPSNKGYFETFTSAVANYWRLKITTTAIAPYVGLWILGDTLDFENYPPSTFDPTAEKIVAKSKVSTTGNLLGTIVSYYSRPISLTFRNVSPSWIDSTFIPAWDSNLKTMEPFVWAWDYGNHPTEVYLVRLTSRASLNMPYSPIFRSLSLNMEGLSES